MKNLFFIILLLFSINIHAQDSSKAILPADIMRAVHPSSKTLQEIKTMQTFDSTFEAVLVQYDKKNGGTEGFKFDFDSYYNYLRKIIFGNGEMFLRQYAAMQLAYIKLYGCHLLNKDTVLELKCLQILKPNDIIWELTSDESYCPILIFSAIYTDLATDMAFKRSIKLNDEFKNKEDKKELDFLTKKSFEYSYAIYKKNPYRIVKADALVDIIENYNLYEKFDKADYYYKILKNNFTDIKTQNIQNALIEFSPEGRLRAGKTMPQFNLALVDSNTHITPAKLKGRYYLLQFWATWCAPCVGEMPGVRKIYDKFKGSNFTILSISLDDSLSALKRYWKKNGAMPWYNVRLDKGYNDKVAKYFGITGVPVIVLVDPQGKILERISQTGEESWSKIISGYLGKSIK